MIDKGKSIVLGVTGGIACYKAVELVRLLIKAGHRVQVVMTRGAMEFVTPLTFQTLSGNPVASETFNLTQESEIGHINLNPEVHVPQGSFAQIGMSVVDWQLEIVP